ncbi:hypothetical protein L243_12720 [Salmonella enterica subsp. enterica serovar Worthington str. BCH-3008]|nr:hypothetical protein L243_12720 [Salmonella enterica subsp. enterica serovar Worthington str. BCH-3008]
MGGILLPGAIFNTKTKRMVEVYGGLIFLVNLKAQQRKTLLDIFQKRFANAVS